MAHNWRIVSTYEPTPCGIATFTKHLIGPAKDLTAEFGVIRVAAIKDDKGTRFSYPPVDLEIEKFNPKSWGRNTRIMINRALEAESPTVMDLMCEFGLDPANEDGEGKGYGRGNNTVNIARDSSEAGLLTVAHVHTILGNPDSHQLNVIQNLGKYCHALIAPTGIGIKRLRGEPYFIEPSKLRRIDHGIRMRDPAEHDRLEEKKNLNLEGILTVTILGLKHYDKGIQYGIRGYGEFVNESLTKEQRENMLQMVLGKWHPNFVKLEPKRYQQAVAEIQQALRDTNLTHRTLERFEDLEKIDPREVDVVFVEDFMNENQWNTAYAISNIGLMPYLGLEQISSGILSDYFGAGRFPIATKFPHAIDLVDPSDPYQEGTIIDENARGILIDPGNSEQIARALDYAVFNEDERLLVEKRAFLRGQQMSQDIVTRQFASLVRSLERERARQTGRGTKFTREKESGYSTNPAQ